MVPFPSPSPAYQHPLPIVVLFRSPFPSHSHSCPLPNTVASRLRSRCPPTDQGAAGGDGEALGGGAGGPQRERPAAAPAGGGAPASPGIARHRPGSASHLLFSRQVQQKNHRDVVAVYRTHLLQAAQGFMDEAVHATLLRILRAGPEA
nr:ankyrin repeat domain-containing protein 35 [Dromaius novaehollandiae]